ncbi:hypothetical protein [Cryobacterium aureum]|uniref:hypothetical protein n=1 Tax=Cryobacterium aureum TaxID=995037 RepID=UPI000CF3E81B|nr:hypothetical protein [Cryobacterium aureum]
MIALVSPGQITSKKKLDGINVLDSNNLRRWLLKRPVELTEVELVVLVAIVNSPATWSAPTSPPSPTLLTQFAVIDREVETARVRHVSWQLFPIISWAAILVLAGPPFMKVVVREFLTPR